MPAFLPMISLAGVTEHRLGAVVPSENDASGRAGGNRVLGVFHNRGEESLRFLGNLPLDRLGLIARSFTVSPLESSTG